MRRFSFLYSLILSTLILLPLLASSSQANQPAEWTLLVFLNGNNSLDKFGTQNLVQMEKVGSTANVNIVVQWASLKTKTIKRMLIKKTGTREVSSPVIETVRADMGDWHSVVDFVKWGSANFPAKHYFLDVWDHGSGWHSKVEAGATKDISLDELTGHWITTQQLGLALTQSAQIIGHKIDIYGSDACLMSMLEIANEAQNSVSIFAGSEELEPAAGWPYDVFLTQLVAKPLASAREIATLLSQDYQKAYLHAHFGEPDATFSVLDLSRLPAVKQAIASFVRNTKSMSSAQTTSALAAAKKSQTFSESDYVDLIDFLTNLGTPNAKSLLLAVRNLVVANNHSGTTRANGVSIWLPQSSSILHKYAQTYSQLKFEPETHWTDFLSALNR